MTSRRQLGTHPCGVSTLISAIILCHLLLSLQLASGIAAEVNGVEPTASELPEYAVHDPISQRKTMQTARLYGSINNYAYYFIDILVGSPPQRQSVIVDTGSALLGFPCATCPSCGTHIDSPFDFSKSETAEWLSCMAPTCGSGCDKNHRCSYTQRYSEGSSITGTFFRDYITIGDQERGNSFVLFDHIGCHDKETMLFETQRANGIMGFNAPPKNQPFIIDALFGAKDVDTKVFALCISDEGGILTFGGYNSTMHRASRFTRSSTQMAETSRRQRRLYDLMDHTRSQESVRLTSDVSTDPPVAIAWTGVSTVHAYTVKLNKIEFNGVVLSNEFGRVLVDSGTTYSYFAADTHEHIHQSLLNWCRESGIPCKTAERTDLISFTLSEAAELESFPPFVVTFGDGSVVEWKGNAYMFSKGHGKWSPGIDSNGASRETLLGASFMKNKDVIFDRERRLIGFVEADCPQFDASHRPPPPSGKVSRGDKTTLPPAELPIPTPTPTPPRLFYRPFYDLAFWIIAGGVVLIVVSVMVIIACQTLRMRSYAYMDMRDATESETDIELAETVDIDEYADIDDQLSEVDDNDISNSTINDPYPVIRINHAAIGRSFPTADVRVDASPSSPYDTT